VLTVQALFFADGGLLALGANIFNLGVFPAFIAYPLFKRVVGPSFSSGRVITGSVIAAELGLLLGAAAVVLETVFSGISALPLSTFMAVMLPIHAAIALVEGLVTAGVVLFVKQAEPGLLARAAERAPLAGLRLKPVLVGLLVAAVVTGGALALAASAYPDGLEWTIARVTGAEEIEGDVSATHQAAASLQERTAALPDYGFPEGSAVPAGVGTSVSGVVGASLTLAIAALAGLVLARTRRRTSPSA
jgi:cobalt/nickel transport system permease protein